MEQQTCAHPACWCNNCDNKDKCEKRLQAIDQRERGMTNYLIEGKQPTYYNKRCLDLKVALRKIRREYPLELAKGIKEFQEWELIGLLEKIEEWCIRHSG
jgi:hypothetical protein